MNTVHEPGPTVTLKYHRSENQSKKPSQMHKHLASPAGTPRCALARPGARMAAVSWQGAGRVAGQCGRVAATVPLTLRASARAPAPSAPAPAPARPARPLAQPTARPAPCRGRPVGRIAGPSAVSQRAPGRIVGGDARQACAQPAQLHNTSFLYYSMTSNLLHQKIYIFFP